MDVDRNEFRSSILHWYDQVKRPLKWRDTTDSYVIWISEIMLQQTRVDQAAPFFERFIHAFPNVHALAASDLQDVLMLWEGLGYYSRARNLHQSAQIIVQKFNGVIPDDWDEIRSLKGIGDYTAAAILSIAYNKSYGVVDGNVIRVISRYLGITDSVNKSSVKKAIQNTMNELIDPARPGEFNQSVMELGSLICTPTKPKCEICPISTQCVANITLQTETIPYKPKKNPTPHYNIAVAIITNNQGHILISKRPDHVMLGGLWEFPGGKVKNHESTEEALKREIKEELNVEIGEIEHYESIKHAYSHFKVTIHAYTCIIKSGNPINLASTELKWISKNELPNYPFPVANRKLSDKLMSDD